MAGKGGKVASVARVQLEKTTGKKIVSNKNVKLINPTEIKELDK